MGQTGVQAVDGQIETVDVRFTAGEAYEFAVRGHRMRVDQPSA